MRREDSKVSYKLAYYPDHNQSKGEWRTIQVKVREPSAAVLTRSGHFALSGATPIPARNRIDS